MKKNLKLNKIGKIGVPAIAAIGTVVAVLAGVMYYITPTQDQQKEIVDLYDPPTLQVADNRANTSLQGFMSTTIGGAGGRDFAQFTEEDIKAYEEKKAAYIEESENKTSNIIKTENNSGVFYMFNNTDKEITMQDIADSIKPINIDGKDLADISKTAFAIAKWDAEEEWSTTGYVWVDNNDHDKGTKEVSKNGIGLWKMSYNSFYATEKPGVWVYGKQYKLNQRGSSNIEKENEKDLPSASEVKIKPGEGFIIISMTSLETFGITDGTIKAFESKIPTFDVCSVKNGGWYNFAVKDGKSITDYFDKCEDKYELAVAWPQVEAKSCAKVTSTFSEATEIEKQCFKENSDGTYSKKPAQLINFKRAYDTNKEGYKNIEKIKEMVFGKDKNKNDFRLTWVRVQKVEEVVEQEDEPVCEAPDSETLRYLKDQHLVVLEQPNSTADNTCRTRCEDGYSLQTVSVDDGTMSNGQSAPPDATAYVDPTKACIKNTDEVEDSCAEGEVRNDNGECTTLTSTTCLKDGELPEYSHWTDEKVSNTDNTCKYECNEGFTDTGENLCICDSGSKYINSNSECVAIEELDSEILTGNKKLSFALDKLNSDQKYKITITQNEIQDVFFVQPSEILNVGEVVDGISSAINNDSNQLQSAAPAFSELQSSTVTLSNEIQADISANSAVVVSPVVMTTSNNARSAYEISKNNLSLDKVLGLGKFILGKNSDDNLILDLSRRSEYLKKISNINTNDTEINFTEGIYSDSANSIFQSSAKKWATGIAVNNDKVIVTYFNISLTNNNNLKAIIEKISNEQVISRETKIVKPNNAIEFTSPDTRERIMDMLSNIAVINSENKTFGFTLANTTGENVDIKTLGLFTTLQLDLQSEEKIKNVTGDVVKSIKYKVNNGNENNFITQKITYKNNDTEDMSALLLTNSSINIKAGESISVIIELKEDVADSLVAILIPTPEIRSERFMIFPSLAKQINVYKKVTNTDKGMTCATKALKGGSIIVEVKCNDTSKKLKPEDVKTFTTLKGEDNYAENATDACNQLMAESSCVLELQEFKGEYTPAAGQFQTSL